VSTAEKGVDLLHLRRGERAERERAGVLLDLGCGHDEAIALVRTAELDLALVFAQPGASAPRDVDVVDLADEPMLALLPRTHPLADADEVALADLSADAWIVGAPDPSSSVIAAACRAAGFEPSVAFETDDPLATQSLVAAGLGVSLTTPWLRAAQRDDVVLLPLAEPAPARRVSAVVAEPAGPGATLLLDLAREAAQTPAEKPRTVSIVSASSARLSVR
jgi:DNA-binding transcriptional LysR family regulator